MKSMGVSKGFSTRLHQEQQEVGKEEAGDGEEEDSKDPCHCNEMGAASGHWPIGMLLP